MKTDKIKYILILVLFYMFGCSEKYDPVYFISDSSKSWLPEDRFIDSWFYNDTLKETIKLYSYNYRNYFTHTYEHFGEESGSSKAYWESIELSYEARYGSHYNFLIKVYPESGGQANWDRFEIIEIDYGPFKSRNKLKIIGDVEYKYWDNLENGYSYPVTLSYIRYDTFELDNKIYFNVYSSVPNQHLKDVMYFQKELGIIAFEMNSFLWINLKLK